MTLSAVPPIILIGMHRSGTTLVANLLERLGLHLGWLLQENSESIFFVERNEALLNACGGRWDHPGPVQHLLRCEPMRGRAMAMLRRDTHSPRFLSFLGPSHARFLGRPERINFPWGWKDPRNSYLLPLWLELFPQAKILHIYRHPMDVARSLFVRENRSIARRVAMLGGASVNADSRRTARDLRKETGIFWLYRRWRAARCVMTPLRRYANVGVTATATLQGGLHLWSMYVAECCRHLESISNPALSVRYEDVLADPVAQLDAIREFCGLPGNRTHVETACSTIRKDRRFAYRDDPEACAAFEAFRDDEWVRRFQYDTDEGS